MNKKKNTATSGKLIKAVYASYVYVYVFFVQVSHLVLLKHWNKREWSEQGMWRAWESGGKYMKDTSPKAWKMERIK